MDYPQDRALELLRIGTGDSTSNFRDDQEEAIRHIVEGDGRLLVVQRTGWGKSFVYFIATKILRENGMGPSLLVSPLLSLIRNQLHAAERMGLNAVTIHSENRDEWPAIEEQVRTGNVDILLISPERFSNQQFQDNVLSHIAGQVSMLVVDEAHCISDWGHDFRPHYRMIARIVSSLPANTRLLATTATANNRVMEDLEEQIGPDLAILRGPLHRPSLLLQTICIDDKAERLAWLAEHISNIAGSGIIYTLTVRDAKQVTDWLKLQGLNVETYTGQSGDNRPTLESALLNNDVKALVATTALGMGFDKPDLAFVVHYQTPGSVVAYYQQVGRAGRGIPESHGILLSGNEDQEINDFFINSAFPTKDEVSEILKALENAPGGLTLPNLLIEINLSRGRLDKTLQRLSLESPAPLVKDGSKWMLTTSVLSDEFWVRAEQLTARRKIEQGQMQEYVSLDGGHMEFLVSALDGDLDGVETPAITPVPETVDSKLTLRAIDFLRRTSLPIDPRRQWPNGGLPELDVKGRIPAGLQLQPGKALCVWGDAGWGKQVFKGKYQDNHFSDQLVEACLDLIKNWTPHPNPAWVTCIPSYRRPELVPNFAQRLAESLSLPYHESLLRVDERPEQKEMQNSSMQARNVDGAFVVVDGDLPNGPVLLIDDMVDSKWTLTIAGWLLQSRGVEAVHSLVLADAGRG